MKVTYNWLKDFVEIKIGPRELADKLTMAGLEVVSLEEKAGDFVFEIEITSNRPDWLSVYGVAREIAAITGKQLKEKCFSRTNSIPSKEKIKISIENKKDTPFYSARVIRGARIGQSPEWLIKRLEAIGCRAVNNVVDITNYLLFELGEPLHAFDLDKLSSAHQIMIRRANPGEKITTIDAIDRKLDKDILVIADQDKPVAIAGIMGGKDTEVSFGTKNILLEAAVFDPILIRRGKQKLGLQSEAAYRFERGVDLSLAPKASLCCASLIKEITGAIVGTFSSSALPKINSKKIKLEIASVKKILGIDIQAIKCKNILVSLGFKVKQGAKNIFLVSLPSYRQDVFTEVDLIEEIARIYGFEKIPMTVAAAKPSVTLYETRDLVSIIKEMLLGLGLNEAITYSLTDRGSLKMIDDIQEPVAILNPLSQDQEVLRTTLLPSLLGSVAHNLNQKQEYVNFFEVAKSFSKAENFPKEELRLGLVLCGHKELLLSQGAVKDEVNLLYIKGIFETIFKRLGINENDFAFEQSANSISVKINAQEIGQLLSLSTVVLEKFDIKNQKVALAEINLEKLFQKINLNKKFAGLPKYPGVIRDISFVVKDGISVSQLLKALNSVNPLLKSSQIIDYYRGKQIPQGFYSVTLSCVYRLEERTLTEEEVNPVHAQVVKLLTDNFGAKIR